MKANEKKLVNTPKKVEDMTPMERYEYGVAKAKEMMGDKWPKQYKTDFTFLIEVLEELEQSPDFIDDLHDSGNENDDKK